MGLQSGHNRLHTHVILKVRVLKSEAYRHAHLLEMITWNGNK